MHGEDGNLGDGEELIASIEQTPIATVVTDPRQPDNPVVAANAAFRRLTGYTEMEITGRNCRFLGGADTDDDRRAQLREAVEAGRPALVELTNYRKDGSPFRNAVMIAPILGEDGAVRYFVGSQMEISSPADERQAAARARVGKLTARQRQVLEHMLRGLRNKQIAGVLDIDEKTVKMHRAAMLVRLGCATSADAIRVGVEAGLAS